MDAGKQAASIAAELLAFYREPALRRPGYLHGNTPMPDGPVVFRLALGRFPESMHLFSASEREDVRVAAAAFVRQACLWERATHYQVLCLDPDAPAEQVKESYHLLIALIHPDRHDSEWPAGCAQRANQAYAVLSDEAQRTRYDEQLLRSQAGAALDSAPAAQAPQPQVRHHRGREAPGPILARFAVVAGVVAALFVVQAWWLGEVSPQHSLLERAMPASGRWVRDVLPDPPRFLGVAFDFGDRMKPIDPPRRMASLGTWVPAPETRAASAPPPAPVVVPVQATANAIPTPEAAPPPVLRMAQAPAAAPARPPSTVSDAPWRDQVEDLVALLVSYYDAGDSEQLVGLFDRDKLGFWSRFNTRNAYSSFFGATRERRIRIDRLNWQANGATAQARGEAIVVAEFQDGRPRLERRVPVELDIVLAGSQARLSRLVLFPVEQ